MDPHGRAGLPWVTLHIDVSLLFAMHTYLLNFISSRVSMTHPDTPISLMSGHFRYDLGNDGRAFTLILSSLLPGHGSFLLWSGQWWTCLHTNIVFVMTWAMMDGQFTLILSSLWPRRWWTGICLRFLSCLILFDDAMLVWLRFPCRSQTRELVRNHHFFFFCILLSRESIDYVTGQASPNLRTIHVQCYVHIM